MSTLASALLKQLHSERDLLDDLIDLVEGGYLQVDNRGDDPRFELTRRGAAALCTTGGDE